MGENPTLCWGVPTLAIDGLKLEKTTLIDGDTMLAPSEIKGSINVDWCKFGATSFSFDVQLTKKDAIRLLRMCKRARLPRKLKKAIKVYMSKQLGKPVKKIRFSFK